MYTHTYIYIQKSKRILRNICVKEKKKKYTIGIRHVLRAEQHRRYYSARWEWPPTAVTNACGEFVGRQRNNLCVAHINGRRVTSIPSTGW